MEFTSEFVECRPVGGIPLKRNDKIRVLQAYNLVADFTPMQYQLVLILLQDGGIVEDEKLTRALFGCDQVDRHLLENLKKHVTMANPRLKPIGLYIRRSQLYGYALVKYKEKAA